MVAVMAGAGLGLERSSALILGGAGMLGQSALGRSGDNVFVNAANGNLVVQNTDEMLFGLGPDDVISRTYNSQTASGANWGQSVLRRITDLTGTINTSGGTVKRIAWDGSDVTYAYDTAKAAYVGKEGPGGYDTLTFSGSTWTWTDGASRVVELYDNSNGGRITSSTDADGNALSFTYNGAGQLTRVTTQDGGYTDLVYTGSLLTSVVTNYTENGTAKTLTRVRYGYDGSNRLSTVTVDLTPTNNSVSDGATYVTTYGYDGASNRIASITQSDGSSLQVAYTQVGGAYRVSSLTQLAASGVTRVTGFSYDTTNRITTVTDPLGQATALAYDAAGQLTSVTAPPAVSGADPQVTAFTYNSKGDVLSVALPDGSATTYAYDANGNLTSEVNDAGVTITRTYGSKNELVTVTRYLTPADGTTAATDPVTTRYAYDAENHLRFVIGAEGDVTEYRYNASGQQTSVIQYTANVYDISALTPTSTLSETNLTTWLAGISDKSRSKRTDTTYDFRGGVATVTAFGKVNADGTGDTTATTEISSTTYVYDQFGRLVSRQPSVAASAEVSLYDGLGRLISTTDFASRTTTFAFNDASSSTVITLANGSTRTSTYNLAGELISYSEAGTGVATATTSFRYDADGRLRIATDATGRSTYSLYDDVGRKTAEIGPDGAVVEYKYDANDRLAATVRYARKLTATELASLVDGSGDPTSVGLAAIRPDADDADRWDWRIYDAADRLIETIDANGAAIVYTYDGAGRLITTRGYALMFDADRLADFKAAPPLELQIPSTGGGFFSLLSVENALPVAAADVAAVKVNAILQTSGNVLANDTDAEGAPLTVLKVNGRAVSVGATVIGTYGSLVLGEDGQYTYTLNNDAPNVQDLPPGAPVQDVFLYTTSDGEERTSIVNVESQNLISYSEEFESWLDGDKIEVREDIAKGPLSEGAFGTRADGVDFDGSDQGFFIDTDVEGEHTVSIWVRKVSGDGKFALGYWDGSSDEESVITATSEWQRYSYTFDGTGDPEANIYFWNTGSETSLEVWGAQLNAGPTALPYVRTYGGPVESTTVPVIVGEEVSTTLTINVSKTTANGAPVLGADQAGVTVDNVVQTTGNVLGNDVDPNADPLQIVKVNGQAAGVGTTIAGTYGVLVLGADGQYTYTLNNDASTVQAITPGQTIQDVFQYSATDGGSRATVVAQDTQNLLDFSSRFDWWGDGGGVSTQDDNAPGPMEALGADYQATVVTMESGSFLYHGTDVVGDHTFSLWIRKVSGNGEFNIGYGGGEYETTYTGLATSAWQRVSVPFEANGAQWASFFLTSLGDGDNTFELWGGQLNEGLTVLPHVETTGAVDSTTVDVPVLDEFASTLTIKITRPGATNPNPTAMNDALVSQAGAPVTIDPLANDVDPNGAALTIESVSTPAHGVAAINPDGTITYTPTAGYAGPDAFTYAISNGSGGTAAASVIVTVASAANAGPVALNDVVTTREGTPLSFSPIVNDSDADGDALTITSTGKPAYGTVAINGAGILTYTPQSGYVGSDSFAYTVSDGRGAERTATVTVTVASKANTGPSAMADDLTTSKAAPLTFNPRRNDYDADGDGLTIVSVDQPPSGRVTINPDGTLTYTPPEDFVGRDDFYYTVSDGRGGVSTNVVFMTVYAPNLFADADADSFSTWDDGGSGGEFDVAVEANYLGQGYDAFVALQVPAMAARGGEGGETSPGALKISGSGPGDQAWEVAPGDNLGVALEALGLGGVTDATVTVAFWDENWESLDSSGAVRVSISDWARLETVVKAPADAKYASIIVNLAAENGAVEDESFGVAVRKTQLVELDDFQSMQPWLESTAGNTNPVAVSDVIATAPGTSLTFNPRLNDTDADNDSLTIVSATSGAHGTVTITTGGAITYAPATGYTGTDSFTYTVSDGRGGTSTATVNVVVIASQNSAPSAVADQTTTNVGQAITFNPRVNDSDADGDGLLITAVGTAAHGTVTINDGWSVTYTPASGYVGADSFTYTVSDGRGGLATATASVTVYPANEFVAPGLGGVITWSQDETGVDFDTSIDPNYLGQGYRALILNKEPTATPYYDGYAATFAGSVGIFGAGAEWQDWAVTPGERLGVALEAIGTGATTAMSMQVWFWDADWNDVSSQGWTYQDITDWTRLESTLEAPANAAHAAIVVQLSGQGDQRTAESFGAAIRKTQLVRLAPGQAMQPWPAPTPVNTAPLALTDAVSVVANSSLSFNPRLNDTDADRDGLMIASVGSPAHGAASINIDGTITYTPTANYVGPDSFTYTISDGRGGSATATVTVGVLSDAPNTAPTAANDTAVTSAGRPVTLNPRVNDADADGDALVITAASTPAHGAVAINAGGTLTYTPTSGYVGADSFTYTVSDGRGGVATATVNVTVYQANEFSGPVEGGVIPWSQDGTGVDFDVSVDPDYLGLGYQTAILQKTPTSAPYYDGYSWTYAGSVGLFGAGSGAEAWDVTGGETLGVALEAKALGAATHLSLKVWFWDEDWSDLSPQGFDLEDITDWARLEQTVIAPTGAAHAAVLVQVIAAGDQQAADTFGVALRKPQFMRLASGQTMQPWPGEEVVNAAPVAASDTASTTAGRPVVIDPLANDSDEDSDGLSLTGLGAPLHGSAVINGNGTVTYAPAAGYTGTDSFSYQVSDGRGGVTTGTITVTIAAAPANTAPGAANDAITTAEGVAVSFNPRNNDTDADGDPLSVTAVSTPTHGAAVINVNGTITYTPATGYSGSDSFTYTLSDGRGGTATATVNVTVTAASANAAPVAVGDSVTSAFNGAVIFNPRTNDTDANGDPLTLSAVSTPAHGVAAINANGTITYTPTTGYSGADSFTYTISDGRGGSATATVSVTVSPPPNAAPTAALDTVATRKGQAVTFDPRLNDGDADGDLITVTQTTTPAHGTVVINADGTLTYTPAAGYSGADTFGYTLSDGRGGTATASVSIAVANVANTGPAAVADLISTTAGAPISFNPVLNDTDADGDVLTVSAVGPATHGVATIASNGTITYRPTAGYVGSDSFTYTVTDGHGGAATTTVSVLVASAAELGGDRVVRNFYDRNGRLVGVMDGEGYFTQTKYDGAGQIIETIAYAKAADDSVRVSGTLSQVLTNIGVSAQDIHNWTLYDGRGFIRAKIDGEGDLTRYHYTALGDVDQVIVGQKLDPATLLSTPPTLAGLPSAAGGTVLETTSYTRDAFGLVQTETKGLTGGGSEVTTYSYDSMRRLISQTQASGSSDARTFNQTFDVRGRLTGELSGVGSAALAALGSSPSPTDVAALYATYGTTYAYDGADRLISKTEPNGANAGGVRTLYYYDANGRLTYEVNPLGEVVQYAYDAFGERVGVVTYGTRIASGALGGLTGGEINSTFTNAITANAALDSQTQYQYGLTGRMSQTIDPLGAVRSYLYNAFGELASELDPITGSTTTRTALSYDRRGLLTLQSQDAAGLELKTKLGYDAFGRVLQVTDPGGLVRASGYDRAGRTLTETDALGRTTTYAYDGRGAVVSRTDRNGKQTTYAYEAFDRKITVTTPEGLTTVTRSNAFGETIKITDGGGRSTTWTYDKDGAVKTATDDLGNVVESTYDKAGRLSYVIDARGSKTSYVYDAADRVLSRTEADGGLNLVTAYSYDAKGQQVSVTDPAGRVTTTAFDLDGRRTSVVTDAGAGRLNLTTTYTYDQAGRVLTQTEAAGSGVPRVTQYSYDNADRLTEARVDPTGLNLTTRYTYDQNGNVVARTGADGKVTRFAYDAENRQVLEVDPAGSVTGASYDGEGRVTATRRYAAIIPGAALLALPQAASLAQLSVSSSSADQVTSYLYDGDGRLRFVIDPTQQVTENVYDGAGNVVRSTAYATTVAAGDYTTASLAAAVNPANSSNRVTRFVYDAANRATFSIDAAGQVTGYAYDGAGNVIRTDQYQTLYADGATPTSLSGWAGLSGGKRTTRTVYDTAGRAVFVVDALNYVSETQYDAAGRVTKSIRYKDAQSGVGDATTAAALKALVGTPTSTAAVTSYAYDTAGRLTDVTDPTGSITHVELDAMGRAIKSTTAYGTSVASRTERSYDAAGRTTAETLAANGSEDEEATTSFTYDGLGRILTITDPRGAVTTRSYDAAGRLQVETVSIGTGSALAVTGYNYDAFGNRTEVIDPRGNHGYFYYDKLNRQVLAVDPEGYATATTYTRGGQPASVSRYMSRTSGAANGVRPTLVGQAATTTFQRDKLDRLTGVIDAQGGGEAYVLNAFGDRVSTTSKLGAVTTRTFDALGRMITEAVAVTRSKVDRNSLVVTTINTDVINTYSYDARGNLLQSVEASNVSGESRTTTYTYDLRDRVLTKSGDPVDALTGTGASTTTEVPTTETYQYDAAGNLIATTGVDGARTLFYYDRRGNKTSQVNALGEMTRWSYDQNGNVTEEEAYATRVTLPSNAGTPIAEPSGASRLTSFTYDKANRLIKTESPSVRIGEFVDGQYVITTGRVTTQRVYDAAGNVIQEIDGRGFSVFTYYDLAGRKIAQVDQANILTTYLLDAEGNVTEEHRYATPLVPAVTAAMQQADVLGRATATADDRITSFTYDMNGRRLTETRRNVNASTVSGSGALGAGAADATISYTYDAAGNVVSKTQATGDLTVWTYDRNGRLVREVGASFRNVEGNDRRPQTQYFYDALGNLTQTWQNAVEHSSSATDRIITYGYTDGWLVFTQDAQLFTQLFYYDVAGRITRRTYVRYKSDQSTTVTDGTIYQYDAVGRGISESTVTLQGGAWVEQEALTTQYNAFGEVTSQGANASAPQVKYNYEGGGRPWRSNAGDGVTKLFLYDENGNRTATITSAGKDLASFADLDAALAYLTANGASLGEAPIDDVVVTIDVYDARNQSVETRQPNRELGAANVLITQKRDYNAFGEVILETNALGGRTQYTYNTLGKVKTSQRLDVDYVDAQGNSPRRVSAEQYFYDAGGRRIGVINPRGALTTELLVAGTGYGGETALTASEFYNDGTGAYKKYEYDAFFNLRRITDENSNVEERSYDNMGRMTLLLRPKRANGTELIEQYTYDGLGQLTKQDVQYIAAPNVPATEYIGTQRTDYDALGRVIKTVAFGGATTNYAYAWSNSLQAGSLPAGGWIKTTVSRMGTESEQLDYFGRSISRTDVGGVTTTYAYDAAGRLTGLSNTASQSLSYEYFSTGRVKQITDNTNLTNQQFTYDKAGDVLTETFFKGAANQKQTTASYDLAGRLTKFVETGAATGGATQVVYAYTATDDIRYAISDYRAVGASSTTHKEAWYGYDQRNRLTFDQAKLLNGQLYIDSTQGVEITYDKAGNRATSRTYMPDVGMRTEKFIYTADGYLRDIEVSDPFGQYLMVREGKDVLGRVTDHLEFNRSGIVVYEQHINYDSENRIEYESIGENGVITKAKAYSYNTNGTLSTITTNGVVTNSYAYDALGRQAVVTDGVTGSGAPRTEYAYDANGQVAQVDVITSPSATRRTKLTVDLTGQTVLRTQSANGGAETPEAYFYSLAGAAIGDVGPDGAGHFDYTRSIQARQGTLVPGAAQADFGSVYEPINLANPPRASSSYVVQGGDTLRLIALRTWGDEGLWYLIADANGLTGGEALAAGRILEIPNQVVNAHNTTATFKVYDPGDVLGAVEPSSATPAQQTAAKSKKKGCGAIGKILQIVVSVALNVVLPGAGSILNAVAANVINQGIGIATGLQNGFSWKSVAMSAVTAGVSKGLESAGAFASISKSAVVVNATRAAAASAISQGIGVATGLQSRFDWAGVAAAGISSGVGTAVALKLDKLGAFGPIRNPKAVDLAARLTSATAGALAGSAAQSLLDGSDFGDNVLSTLPYAVVSTIGNMVAGQVANGGVGRGLGKVFGAIGDTLGFDGDFGYDGANGPDGSGRNLSLGGLGNAIERVIAPPTMAAATTEPLLADYSAYGSFSDALYRPGEGDASLQLIQNGGARFGGRFGIGGNRPPPEYTMMREVFPGLANPVAGSILAPIDGFLGITAPGEAANLAATELQFKSLYNQMRELDPGYRAPDSLQSLEQMSWQGRNAYIGEMRLDRATALYNIRGDIEPLQVETLRFLQRNVDRAYEEGTKLYESGRLNVHLGRNEAIGNYVDVTVRRDLRIMYNQQGISTAPGQPVRVNSREYDTSGTDRTYKIPDSRVGDIAFDVTLTPKAPGSAQVRGFFSADFAPRAVVIVRPSQLGQNSTYLITRPATQPGR